MPAAGWRRKLGAENMQKDAVMNPGVDTNVVASAFSRRYYHGLQTDPHTLAPFYHDGSLLTFEGENYQGAGAIIGKLQSITAVTYEVEETYAQPSLNGGICVLVKGTLRINQYPTRFWEFFQIMPTTEDYWILNQIFRSETYDY